MATEAFAPAKINLSLHVTGRRADGYHLLDSLVAFAGVGDTVTAVPAETLTLAITGPQAAHLPLTDDNLVLRAARAMGATAALTLRKVLPIASGIGGGSADAAATLRALAALTERRLPDATTVLSLGADVPVCLVGRSARMQGVGETLAPVTLPPAWLVLVNPGLAISTAAVFRALDGAFGPPMPAIPPFPDAEALAAFLAAQRNDLAPAALTLAPAIGDALAALAAQPGCRIARMSGSGATCYGLFSAESAARAAVGALTRSGWWVAAAPMLG